jgi:type IV secretory pathway VirB10-like protein
MGADAEPASAADIARELRLHAAATPVVRLSSQALFTLGVVARAAIAGAVAFALAQKPAGKGGSELYQTGAQHPPEAMAALPADYASLAPKPAGAVPELGPPLPGDLGRPILAAGQAGSAPAIGAPGAASPGAATSPAEPSPAQQALAQERESARTSHLFTQDPQGQPLDGAAPIVTAAPAAAAESPHVAGEEASSAAISTAGDVNPARLRPPASPYVLQAGAVIPAALLTGLRSDLPGQVIAQVTQNLYDSLTGRILLAPQGSKLIGTYDSQLVFGQSRVFLAWTRLILPNGRSLDLPREPGADAAGYAGLQDSVDHHWRALLGAALLSTILSVGTQAGASDTNSALIQALREGAAGSLNQAGEQVVSKTLSLSPTLTIRPGFPLRVLVTRDLVLEPYQG